MAIVLATLAVATSASAEIPWITSADGPADATAPAERGARVQVEPIPPPPIAAGCTTGTVSRVAATTDPAQRWLVGTVSTNWKVALYTGSGPRGTVAVIGDSLTLAAQEETMRYLINAGFGPICIDGGVARRVGPTTNSPVSSGVEVIGRIRASDPVWSDPSVHWVLAFGTNDVGSSTSTYAAAIQRGIAAVGVTSYPIRWVDVRTRRNEDTRNPARPDWRFLENTWNAKLVAAGLRIIGWSAATATTPSRYIIALPDYVHLTTTGEVLRGDLIGQSLVAG